MPSYDRLDLKIALELSFTVKFLFFSRLDYAGIAFLNIGSFIPYLYYSFYCILWAKLFYVVLIVVLGSASIIVSMHPSFTTPPYRPLRAGVFMGLGLSGIIPCIHTVILDGFINSIIQGSLGWLVLMAVLYLSGATIYAVRIPERLFPGRFDIWFQSHQIFHVFVVFAALVHYHGLVKLADYRLSIGDCKPDKLNLESDRLKILGLDILLETL
ncbi:Adiponectin receptor protein 2 [Schistosoma japonicum]|nr:Adiponectin receptor protein 2 [Schistosoma japonicum]